MVALMYSSGLRIGEVCHLRYEDINRKTMKVHILHSKTGRNVLLLFPDMHWISSHSTGLNVADQRDGCFQNKQILPGRLIPFSYPDTSTNTKNVLAGQKESPAILSAMLWEHICTKTEPIY